MNVSFKLLYSIEMGNSEFRIPKRGGNGEWGTPEWGFTPVSSAGSIISLLVSGELQCPLPITHCPLSILEVTIVNIQILQVDAFTDRPFRGNPAAVCLLEHPAEAEWMQQVAAEMNLSETAFLCREKGGYRLRWFTPTVEVDLCGHATLASAHTLWEVGAVEAGQPIEFYTRSGVLGATRQGEWIELNFPAKPPKVMTSPEGLDRSLGAAIFCVSYDGADYLVEVASEDVVRQLQPDFVQLATLPVRGIIVTSLAASSEYDFVSRFFAPAVGINEDPVTGSAHCALGPFWQQRLHRDEFLAYQASARGGFVRVKLKGDRVYLGGQAITVFQGELRSS